MMQAVGSERTPIELTVSRALSRLGVKHRRNVDDLPGTPDLSNKTRRWAIFVHGCFWHGHRNCTKTKGGSGGRIPASNRAFWAAKIADNRRRDARKARELRKRRFRVLTVWECQTRDSSLLDRILSRFFATSSGPEPPR